MGENRKNAKNQQNERYFDCRNSIIFDLKFLKLSKIVVGDVLQVLKKSFADPTTQTANTRALKIFKFRTQKYLKFQFVLVKGSLTWA